MALSYAAAQVARSSRRLFPLGHLARHRSTAMATIKVKELEQNEFWQKKLHQAVKSHDADKDGVITRKDIELIANRYRSATKSDNADAVVKTLLSFCDGVSLTDSLTYEEFAKGWLELMLKDPHQELWPHMFMCLDFNGDGVIDMNEWKIHNAAMGILPEHAEESFKAMDTDKDGLVSESEFSAYHTEYFLTTENKLNSAILYGPN